MAMKNIARSPKMPSWAIKAENYLLLLRKEDLVELLQTAGQSVSSLRHRSPEKIRQTLLSLPQETLAIALRERMRRLQKTWH